MAKGVVDIAKNIKLKKVEELKEKYEKEVEAVLDAMTYGKDKVGKYGLGRVDVGFLEKVLEVFWEFEERMEEREPEWSMKETK